MAISVEKIRNAINNNSLVVSIATVVVIIALVFFLINNMGLFPWNRPHIPTKSYFVEEEDMTVSEHPIADIPPLLGKSGKPTLVRGVYYTFTTNNDKKLAYLEKYTEKAKAAMEKMQKGGQEIRGDETMIAEQGLWVRAPDSPKWVPAMSEDGQKVMSRVGAEGTGNPPSSDPKNLRIVLPN